ncbi:MAG: hypothetical protein ACI8P3_000253 [Saprospiraceae bacterium]|jgi:hypothetical protein
MLVYFIFLLRSTLKANEEPKAPVGKRMLDMDKRIKWEHVVFFEWYGNRNKEMMITSGVAIWHKSNTVMVKIKRVLIKDPEGKLEPVLLGCTDIERSTPTLMALFSIICLMGNTLHKGQPIKPNAAAWYPKKDLPFSDVLAAVRIQIFRKTKLSISNGKPLV